MRIEVNLHGRRNVWRNDRLYKASVVVYPEENMPFRLTHPSAEVAQKMSNFPKLHARDREEIMKILVANAVVGIFLWAAMDASAATKAGTPHLSVQYGDSFQGISALLAVRACVPPDHQFVLESRHRAVSHDVFLRLLDGHGREVARFSGSKGVCGFARFAADYIQLDALSVPETSALRSLRMAPAGAEP